MVERADYSLAVIAAVQCWFRTRGGWERDLFFFLVCVCVCVCVCVQVQEEPIDYVEKLCESMQVSGP